MTGYQSKKASAQDKLTQWLEALHHSQEPESVDAQPDDPTGQAPCVRHCESTAYEIVIRGLKGDIERLKAAQPAPVQSVESVRYWLKAYSDPTSGEHFQGHGMIVQLLQEYLSILEATPPAAQPAPVPERKHHRHTWGKDGEGCVVCGDKDWMDTSCKLPAQPAQERNFCPRCGKRTNDIHTCTPPQENT
jgi:hypothetical protein